MAVINKLKEKLENLVKNIEKLHLRDQELIIEINKMQYVSPPPFIGFNKIGVLMLHLI
jgi:hypothetical protein